jgi:hypothetical protein
MYPAAPEARRGGFWPPAGGGRGLAFTARAEGAGLWPWALHDFAEQNHAG